MKKEEFDKLVKTLRNREAIRVHYRCNWRGGDGRPHDHRKGKEFIGEYCYCAHGEYLVLYPEKRISYKSIKSIERLRGGNK